MRAQVHIHDYKFVHVHRSHRGHLTEYSHHSIAMLIQFVLEMPGQAPNMSIVREKSLCG